MNRHYLPNRIMAHYDPQGPDPQHPLTSGKGLVNGQAALYVCRNFACQTPITEPSAVASALGHSSADAGSASPPSSKTLQGTQMPGCATSGGTAAYAVRIIGSPGRSSDTAHGYTTLGATGLTTSRLGFGGYRTSTEDQEHREALTTALLGGCNLIDTST
ncbi:MAG: hypothetical protein H0X01_10645, partial [Nitrospira sp.]|nr:hypothetical protein [Nitrospira sp.]